MQLPEISIKQPILAAMMSLALILFGVIGLSRLPVRELPDVDPPIVNVSTIYPGASAAVIETQVTEPIEEALTSVEGIKTLSSQSNEQMSSITVEFDLSRDVDLAAQDVRDRVARVRGRLPEDVEEPIVAKQDADASPSIWIALFSDRYTTLELTQMAENTFKDRLQSIPGVSSILLGGQKRFAIRIWLDSEKMAARQVTVLDVERALREQSVELPSGRVENLQRELSIETKGELKTPEEFNELVIKQNGVAFVRLKDIGEARVGVEDERSVARFNSKPSLGIGVVKQSKANLVDVAHRVKEELEHIKEFLPEGVNVAIPYDESVYVEKSIQEVGQTLGVAFALVIASIFIFLRNFRSTVIPAVTIPVSIIATFGILYALGYSINIITMLSLVLAIGLVVDDAIVVLENIYRHVEMGKPAMEAALEGMKEITFAVIATTVALVAVFLPLTIQTSLTGRLFIEFAVSISFAVVISTFVALSLAPMIASRILRPAGSSKYKFLDKFETFLERLTRKYERLLRGALDKPVRVMAAGMLALLLAFFFFSMLDKEFLPEEDKGRLFCVAIAPVGSTSEYTDRMVRKMEGIIQKTPEVEGYFSAVALARGGIGQASQGLAFIRLKEERKRHVTDIVNGPTGLAGQFFGQIEGALTIPIIPKAIGRGFSQSFQLVLQNQDLKELNTYANELSKKLQGSGYLMNVRSTFEMTKPELRVHIDRNRAAALGISIRDISRTLQILFGGQDLSKVNLSGKEYDVIAQLEREARLTPNDLERLYIRNNNNDLIQLSNVVSYDIGGGPSGINHYNRFRSATIEATPVGLPLGTVVSNVEALLAKDLPKSFRYEWAGEAKDLKDAGYETVFVLILAVIVIYMVLASQFGSLVHPLTVMLTLPLAAFGAFGSLWALSWVNKLGTMLYGWSHYAPDPPFIAKLLSGIVPRIPAMSFNLFSQIGMVLLLGLVTKNAILLVDFANQAVKAGKTAKEAMVEAGLTRFRPILMTTVSTVVGILPIAVGFGSGAESRRPLGVVAVGGMSVSTVLTLFIIPVVYVFFSRIAEARRQKRGQKNTQGGISKSAAAALILMCLVLSGCAVGPSYVRPEAPVPAEWKHDSNQALIENNQAVQKILNEKWWTIFGDERLNQLIEQAISSNQNLKGAVARVDQARAAARITDADFWPTVSGNPSFTRRRINASSFGSSSSSSSAAFTRNTFQMPLDLSYEIDVWGKVRRSFESARAQANASSAEYRTVLLMMASDLARNYFELRSLDSELLILKDAERLRQQAFNVVNDRFKAGLVSELDLARSKTELAAVDVSLQDTLRRRAEFENAVALLTGAPASEFHLESSPLNITAPAVPAGLPSSLLERRPDVLRAEYMMQSANAEIGVAQAAFYPSFSLTGSAGYESLDLK
ncbi:MAG: efflux transporter outer membrane subunit, partial [Candidatus Omnitrophica bacterium]|nr:efflux transporter outer membrane subunit [Candidatus Omnitrophota bacterium]